MKDRFVDSMLNWYPKIKDLNIPQPRTTIVHLTEEEYFSTMDAMPFGIVNKVYQAIKEGFNFPVFIRTDQSSAKHYWKDACFYDGQDLLWKHLYQICEFNHCADFMGLPFRAIVIREYIEMDSAYTAFENMPVNPERRYFVKDGKVICHHYYWIKDAILNPSVKNWQTLSEEMNLETEEEIKLLTSYAEKVSKAVDAFWSVDFCKAKDGRWILIDMATGENSWHPAHNKEVL